MTPLTFEQTRSLFRNGPHQRTEDDLDTAIRTWLGTVGYALEPAGEAGPRSVVVFLVDEGLDCRVYAVPDETIPAWMRADLAQINDRCFAILFATDLEPAQFGGALLMLSHTDQAEDFLDNLDLLREEVDGEVDVKWEALEAGAGSWQAHLVEPGGRLPGPPTHCYCVLLGM